MRRVAYTALLSAMAVLIFAAIAVAQSSPEQNAQDGTQASDPAQNTLTISIHEHAFDPAQLDVPAKTTVTWVNDDTEPHSAASDDGKLFDSGVLQPGQSYSVWFDGAGNVTYHCKIHPDMKGSLAVGGGVATTPENTTSDTTQPAADSTQPAGDTTGQTEDTQPADDTQTTHTT